LIANIKMRTSCPHFSVFLRSSLIANFKMRTSRPHFSIARPCPVASPTKPAAAGFFVDHRVVAALIAPLLHLVIPGPREARNPESRFGNWRHRPKAGFRVLAVMKPRPAPE